ncbi:toll/interleukin-1 receptor domain-containing protein [Candidatus Thiodictyon syntrophicum]|jgi:hypothetical protein|uniref:TIR domain-containing protein n=1 Tax=Candidatus Thiodictyon syntrophicum TaxID=1166950 RepID=A0A2K8UDH4_9GAMM|nr:toll/interleukin-1 receptor domain-containing protein [Candidatus Thiodictyon syntrophicum]AUB83479.1 hypothetical protein THSYN_22700 [Candidatus Thiodictyon syntrophicum]
MPDGETFDCFLSHNSRAQPAVRALAAQLRDRGLTVWLDEEQLRPGLPWQPLLESGIRAARSVAVLVGADGLGPWEQKEMRAALSLAVKDGRPVIPVLLADAPAAPELPLFLAKHMKIGGQAPEMIALPAGCFQMGSPPGEPGAGMARVPGIPSCGRLCHGSNRGELRAIRPFCRGDRPQEA